MTANPPTPNQGEMTPELRYKDAFLAGINGTLTHFGDETTPGMLAETASQIACDLITAQVQAAEARGRRDELLEIGLLAHKFEGEDYHCREIADAIDDRLAALGDSKDE